MVEETQLVDGAGDFGGDMTVPENNSRNADLERKAPRSAMSPIAWEPGDALSIIDWIQVGKRLGTIGRGASWWIGDWVNYGNRKFGEKYTRAAQITGYDMQTLMNMSYVALRFNISRRRENLSWSHHAEVAALPPEERDRWLNVAQTRRLSVRSLREELRAWRTGLAAGSANASDADPGLVQDEDEPAACPRCGYVLHEGPA